MTGRQDQDRDVILCHSPRHDERHKDVCLKVTESESHSDNHHKVDTRSSLAPVMVIMAQLSMPHHECSSIVDPVFRPPSVQVVTSIVETGALHLLVQC